MSPHETLFLESTTALDIKYIANNPFVQFQIWDFPGDYDFKGARHQALGVRLTSPRVWLRPRRLLHSARSR